MIKVEKIVVDGLYEELGVLLVPQNSNDPRPDYPFMTYNTITPYAGPGSGGNLYFRLEDSKDKRFESDVVETLEIQPTITMSINSYCKGKVKSDGANIDNATAYKYAKKAYSWFKHSGYMYLSRYGIVTADIKSIKDRAALLETGYEARYGFDVILRFTDEIELRYETIEEKEVGLELVGLNIEDD